MNDSDDEIQSWHLHHHVIHEEDGETSSIDSGKITPWMDPDKEELIKIQEEKSSASWNLKIPWGEIETEFPTHLSLIDQKHNDSELFMSPTSQGSFHQITIPTK